MTDDRSLERAARSWIEEGPTLAPERPVQAALARIQTTPQERAPLVPWRMPYMNTYVRFAAAAIVAVVAIGGAVYLLGDGGGGTGTAPTPSPSVASSADPTPTPTPEPTPIDAATWETYGSPMFGFTIGHPADWNINPATEPWDLETEGWRGDLFERPSDDGEGLGISAWSVPIEGGSTLSEWVAAYCEVQGDTCDQVEDRAEPVVAAQSGDLPGMRLVPGRRPELLPGVVRPRRGWFDLDAACSGRWRHALHRFELEAALLPGFRGAPGRVRLNALHHVWAGRAGGELLASPLSGVSDTAPKDRSGMSLSGLA